MRNYALDLLRGLTIALMIIVNNPGDWKAMFTILRHAEWHGFLGADIVFPLFLFVAGYAAALKIDRLYGPISAGGPHCASALTLEERELPAYYLPLMRRAAILFLIGLFLNAWPFGLLPGTEFSFEKLRLFGVLQRIALCVFVGGIVLRRFMTAKSLFFVLLLIAAVYEFCMRVPLVQAGDFFFGRSFALQNNFARFADTSFFPAAMLYKVKGMPFDPEGLFTTITAVMTFLLGGLTFRFVSAGSGAIGRRVVLLVTALAIMGFVLLSFEPINKNLWTLPYVLLTGAAGVLLLAVFAKINGNGFSLVHRISLPFAEMGRNPLLIYVLSVLVGKTLALWKLAPVLSVKQVIFGWLLFLPVDPKVASLLYSLLLLLLLAIVSHWLRRTPLAVR